MNYSSTQRTIACVLATLLSVSFAVAGDIDVLVAQPAPGFGTKTFVGSVDKGTSDGDVDPTARVFEAEVIFDPTDDLWEAEEPGFFTGSTGTIPVLPSNALAAVEGSTVSVFKRTFTVGGATSDLFYWNGDLTNPVNFVPATGATFELEPEGLLLEGPGDPAEVNDLGQFDEHPDFIIEGIGGGSVPIGVYLTSVDVTLNDPSGSFEPSDPVYIVFSTRNAGLYLLDPSVTDNEEIEEAAELVLEPAAEWVQANVVVPEPTAGLLAVLAATGVVATRKRR